MAPQLDGAFPDEIRALWDKYEAHRRAHAEAIGRPYPPPRWKAPKVKPDPAVIDADTSEDG